MIIFRLRVTPKGCSQQLAISNQCTDSAQTLPFPTASEFNREVGMLWTIFIILLVLWLLGLVSGTTLGGFIHVLLVIAIVVVLIRVISGRRAV
jgi:hypothetical protein